MPLITLFDSLTQPIGRTGDLPWPKIFDDFERGLRDPFDERRHPGWSPAVFRDNRRAKQNVLSVCALVLDFDQATETAQALFARWSRYQCCVHTTKSNDSSTCQRLRLIVPLSRTVTPAEYDALWEAAKAREPTADAATKDASRFWFLPSSLHPEHAVLLSCDGPQLDPSTLQKSVEIAERAVLTAPKGARNKTLHDQVYAMGRAGVATSDAIARVESSALSIGLAPDETRKTIASALRGAATVPSEATETPLTDHIFTRGDHLELTHYVRSKFPLVAHDGQQFLEYQHNRWVLLNQAIVSQRIAGLEGCTVAAKTGATRLKINAATIDGVAKIWAAQSWRNFEKPAPGITFADVRVTIRDGHVVTQPFSPDDLSQCAHDFAYDPDAQAPEFDAMIDRLFAPDGAPPGTGHCDERAMILQEFIGASMFGIAPKYACAMLLLAGGGNGKSTLMTALECVFPRGTTQAVAPSAWGNDFVLSTLVGALCNIVHEMPTNAEMHADVFKAVVAGDVRTVNVKFKQPVKRALIAGHLFSGNKLPATNDQTDGFYRRWCIIQLTKQFTKRSGDNANLDRDLGERIARNEAPGVVAWAVRGVERLLRQNAYTRSALSEQLVNDWRGTSDTVAAWLAHTRDTVDHTPTSMERTVRLHFKAYHEWAKEGGYQPVNERNFITRLDALGVQKKRRASGVVVCCQCKNCLGNPEENDDDAPF